MKKLYIPIFTLLSISSFGQIIEVTEVIDSFQSEINFSTRVMKNKTLGLEILQTTITGSKFPNRIKEAIPKIDDADLVLTAKLVPSKKNEIYNFGLKIKNNTPQAKNLINTKENKPIKRRYGSTNLLSWKNVLEKEIFPEIPYTLTYKVRLIDRITINCDKPPNFTPYRYTYIAGIAFGGGLMIYSQEVTKPKVQENINLAAEEAKIYANLWQDGTLFEKNGPVEQSVTDNKLFLDNARSYNDKQQDQFKNGRNIMIASGLIYTVHYLFIYLPKKKQFDKYKGKCPQKQSPLMVNPVLAPGTIGLNNQQLGLNLTYTF